MSKSIQEAIRKRKAQQAKFYNKYNYMASTSYSGVPSFLQAQLLTQLQGGQYSANSGLGSAYYAPPFTKTIMSNKFKVGDRVRLNADGLNQYHYQSGGTDGVVQGCTSDSYVVTWDNGNCNQYYEYLLELVKEVASSTSKKVTMESVILSKDKKKQIISAISQVENTNKIFEEWGFSEVFEKGTAVSLLFWGIPGTGKTLMAQAVADHLKLELKVYGPAEIESSEPGGAERTIKTIFSDARKNKKVVLFDECDSLLVDRNEVGPIFTQLVNTLLSEIEYYDGVIIFTTNRLGKLDPALERRITAKVEFPFPDKKQRKEIWKRMIPKKAPLNKDVDFNKLSDYPLAGGNIKNSVLNAARSAAYEKSKDIKMAYFIEAIEKESEALQAFTAEYDKHPHQQNLGGGTMTRGEGKNVVERKMSFKYMREGFK